MKESVEVRMVPVAKINVLNPRNRDAKKFAQIAANIKAIGIKRPIAVTPSKDGKGGYDYELVCGQGRLESVIKMGCTEIPAIVVDILAEIMATTPTTTPRLTRASTAPQSFHQGNLTSHYNQRTLHLHPRLHLTVARRCDLPPA